MANVIPFSKNGSDGSDGSGGDGGGPTMSDLTERVKHLEREIIDARVSLTRIEGHFDTVNEKFETINSKLDGLATKSEIADAKVSMIQWAVATILASGALVFGVMRLIGN